MQRIGGAAVSDHLAVVARRRGKPVSAEKPPPLPQGLAWLWDDFIRLGGARQVSFSAQPISYQEIAAYQVATANRLPPWGVDLIRQLDDLWLAAVAEQTKKGAVRK